MESGGRIARRVPLDGGKVERLGESYEMRGVRANSDHILVHHEHVYWNAAHSVVRVPRTGGGDAQVVVTADIPGDIQDFAVDDTHIYVTARIYEMNPR